MAKLCDGGCPICLWYPRAKIAQIGTHEHHGQHDSKPPPDILARLPVGLIKRVGRDDAALPLGPGLLVARLLGNFLGPGVVPGL